MSPYRSAVLAGALLALGIGTITLIDVSDGSGLIGKVFAAAPLPDAEIQSRLQDQGYSDLKDFRHEGRRVIVTANKDGRTEQLVVDPRTGVPITGSDDDDDDD